MMVLLREVRAASCECLYPDIDRIIYQPDVVSGGKPVAVFGAD